MKRLTIIALAMICTTPIHQLYSAAKSSIVAAAFHAAQAAHAAAPPLLVHSTLLEFHAHKDKAEFEIAALLDAYLKRGHLLPQTKLDKIAAQLASPEVIYLSYKGFHDMTQKRMQRALEKACLHEHIPIAHRLIGLGIDVNIKNKNQNSLLIGAVENNNITLASLVLAHSADANVTTRFGATALMCAATHNDPTMYELLLSHGANLVHSDTYGLTIFDIIKSNGHTYDAIIGVLKKFIKTKRPLANIAESMQAFQTCMENYIDRASHIQVTDELYRKLTKLLQSPLYQLFIRYNVDNLLAALQEVLFLAATYGHDDLLRSALTCSSPDIVNPQGRSALMRAAINGHANAVGLIIPHTKTLTHVDHRGNSALYYATAYKYHDCMRLLATPATINQQYAHGNTALIRAARNGDRVGVDILLKSGASIALRRTDGISAIRIATNYCHNDEAIPHHNIVMRLAELHLHRSENVFITEALHRAQEYNNQNLAAQLQALLDRDANAAHLQAIAPKAAPAA